MTNVAPTVIGTVSKPILYARDTTSGYLLSYRGEVIADVEDGAVALAPRFTIDLFSGNESTSSGSSTKLALGSKRFNPSDTAWALTPDTTATLYALIETTNATQVANAELFQLTGTGSPQICGATTTTTANTPTLCSVDVSSFFNSTSAAGIYQLRIWASAPDGANVVTCSGAWIEVTPLP
jgi:hypothetical protein